MKRMIPLLAAVLLSTFAAPAEAVVATRPTASDFLSTNTITLKVRTTGVDRTADGTSSLPFQTLAAAMAIIPDGYIAQVIIDLDANTYALPDMTFTSRPGSATVSGSHQHGQITVRGSCSTAQTIALAKTWTLVSSRKAQVTSNIGAFTGTVTDGSHFVRIGTDSPYTYHAVRASTTPNLVVVNPSTASYLGSLCAYETVLSGSTTFSATLSPDHQQHIVFEAVQFSGSPNLNNVRLNGSSIATPTTTAGGLRNTDLIASYLGAVSNMVGDERGLSTFTQSLSKGCVNIYGFWSTISGVISSSVACSYAQLNMGGPIGIQPDGGIAVTGAVGSPPTSIRRIEEIDIEGTSNDCIYMSMANAVLGSGHGEDMTCNPTTAGRFGIFTNNARFGVFSADSTITGTVFLPTKVLEGSVVGPLNGAYSVTQADGGVFVVGTTVVGTGALPAASATQLSHAY